MDEKKPSPEAAEMMEILELLDILDDPSMMLVRVKYLLFDLEATCRENEHLRHMLEQDGADNN